MFGWSQSSEILLVFLDMIGDVWLVQTRLPAVLGCHITCTVTSRVQSFTVHRLGADLDFVPPLGTSWLTTIGEKDRTA
jgi:hypothetical protein